MTRKNGVPLSRLASYSTRWNPGLSWRSRHGFPIFSLTKATQTSGFQYFHQMNTTTQTTIQIRNLTSTSNRSNITTGNNATTHVSMGMNIIIANGGTNTTQRHCQQRSFASTSTVEPTDQILNYKVFPSKVALPDHAKEEVPHSIYVIHGLLGSCENWFTTVRALCAQHANVEYICVDMRNHGKSFHSDQMKFDDMVEDLIRLHKGRHAAHTGKISKNFSLIGHSLGGKMAMRIAIKYPEMVKRLVVVDISPKKTDHEYNQALLHRMQHLPEKYLKNRTIAEDGIQEDENFGDVSGFDSSILVKVRDDFKNQKGHRLFILKNLAKNKEGTLFEWKPNVPVLQKEIEPELSQFPLPAGTAVLSPDKSIQFNWEDGKPAYLDKDLQAIIQTKDESTLSQDELRARLSVLFIRGGNSDFIKLEEDAAGIKALFPSSKIVTIDGASHLLHMTHPEETVRTLLDFL